MTNNAAKFDSDPVFSFRLFCRRKKKKKNNNNNSSPDNETAESCGLSFNGVTSHTATYLLIGINHGH